MMNVILAQIPTVDSVGSYFWVGVLVVFGGITLLSLLMFLTRNYKRCPSNRVLVIYGKVAGGTSAKCIHGGAAFVVPIIQDYNWLTLEPMQIEIPLKDALSIENIRVNVPSVFTVAIGTNPQVMQNAAVRLLGLDLTRIKQQAQDMIFGQLRQVIASMRIEDINRDREKFLQSIQNSLEPELQKIGLVLINVNITDITDASGYIEAIGQKAASQAIQQARGDVAEQEKLGDIRVAEAQREKAVQVASAVKSREIGMREAQREQAVRVAELDKEQKIGEQTASRDQAVRFAELDKERKVAEQRAQFEREAAVKNAEQQMRIQIAEANSKAIAGETKSQAEIVAVNAALQVKQAEAYQLTETRKREAEASVQTAQNLAMAKAALAEAERIEAERRAALEAPAKAEKAKMIVDAEAEGARKRIDADAQAAATFARLKAQAMGDYEILARKAEGLKLIVDACGGSKQAFQMLLLEHLDTLAQTSAQAISKIKFDKIIVWENGTKGGGTAGFLQNLAKSMPPMLQVMKDIGGIEMPESIIKVHTDETAVAPVAPAAESVAETPEAHA